MSQLSHKYFRKIHSQSIVDSENENKNIVLTGYVPVFGSNPIVLFSEDGTPLAAFDMQFQYNKNDEENKCFITQVPSNDNNMHRFQAVSTRDNVKIQFVITNLSPLGMINYNLLKCDKKVTDVNPAGLNEINELRPLESYAVQSDYTQNNKVLMLSSNKTTEGKQTTLADEIENEKKGNKSKMVGSYLYLSIAADITCKELCEKYAKTYWKPVDYFVVKTLETIARVPKYPYFRYLNDDGPIYDRAGGPVAYNDGYEHLIDLPIAYPAAAPAYNEPRRNFHALNYIEAQAEKNINHARMVQRDNVRGNSRTGMFESFKRMVGFGDKSHNAKVDDNMFGAVEAVIPRGEHLDVLEERCEVLATQAHQFRTTSKSVAYDRSDVREEKLEEDDDEMDFGLFDGGDGDNVSNDASDDRFASIDEESSSYKSSSMKQADIADLKEQNKEQIKKQQIQDQIMTSKVANIGVGDEIIHVYGTETGVGYDYDHVSAPCVIGLSIMEGFKFIEADRDGLIDKVKEVIKAYFDKDYEKFIQQLKVYNNEECCMCMTDKPNGVFYRCGHLCTCDECYNSMKMSKCPVCDTHISARIPYQIEAKESDDESDDDAVDEVIRNDLPVENVAAY